MSYKPKVFLSGGFKSNWQLTVIEQLNDQFIFFNPREHGLEHSDFYTTWDIHFVKECDILFAYMEASNPSGYGLAFELGVAYSLNKTIILVDEKSKEDPMFAKYFKILNKPSGVVLNNLAEGIEYLEKFSLQNV
ncbi:nucleoside 2-deoxyribosyltransferase domain-containing protein [Chitinophaga sp.]|uniref:nucleoside 2-deoxyribosyltransferase domain-containing protein n=1 Tax=Chitinophaga sp. TaxID=1869181 RepID=UPI0031E3BF6E